jgi:hypothetical protein
MPSKLSPTGPGPRAMAQSIRQVPATVVWEGARGKRLPVAPDSMPFRALRRLLAVACVLLLHVAACDNSSTGVDGRDWLDFCRADVDCARGTCACGVCTSVCMHNAQCEGARAAACFRLDSPGVTNLCGIDFAQQLRASNHEPAGICLATCDDDATCPSGQRCNAGVCLPPAAMLDAGGRHARRRTVRRSGSRCRQ